MSGIAWAFLAFAAWGVGDFLIQRTTRKIGDWQTLFFICFLGSIVLFPFVYDDLHLLFSPTGYGSLIVLLATSFIMTFAALFDFEALKRGKISIIEPVLAFELPVTVSLSALFLSEVVSIEQLAYMAAIFAGIVLVSMTDTHLKSGPLTRIVEKGVILAGIGSIGMGLANFMIGFASRATDPVLVNWFMSTVIALVTAGYLFFVTKDIFSWEKVRKNALLVLGVSLFDNIAWVAYAFATVLIPVSLASGISEGYIAFAAILGVVFNGERLRKHQVLGVVLAIGGAIALAFTAP